MSHTISIIQSLYTDTGPTALALTIIVICRSPDMQPQTLPILKTSFCLDRGMNPQPASHHPIVQTRRLSRKGYQSVVVLNGIIVLVRVTDWLASPLVNVGHHTYYYLLPVGQTLKYNMIYIDTVLRKVITLVWYAETTNWYVHNISNENWNWLYCLLLCYVKQR